MKIVQVKLESITSPGTKIVCWLPLEDVNSIKSNAIIELSRMPDHLWKIEQVYKDIITEQESIHRKWNVGGL